jgi:hypothetical protein
VLIPLRLSSGVPDVTRLQLWTAVCDRCGARTTLGNSWHWLISRTDQGHIYCPPCTVTVAADLIGGVLGPSLPVRLARLVFVPLAVATRAARWMAVLLAWPRPPHR